ncbi:unnamed protein product [Cladocopium goreaui]|uniref:Uncharacterized protein n=1 Tax=Cladocopium goreaui TaxID=2562237 RepID=A0A9P1GJA8_9DINO|nr:unnamed protein product [Cladocopium goreaui]
MCTHAASMAAPATSMDARSSQSCPGQTVLPALLVEQQGVQQPKMLSPYFVRPMLRSVQNISGIEEWKSHVNCLKMGSWFTNKAIPPAIPSASESPVLASPVAFEFLGWTQPQLQVDYIFQVSNISEKVNRVIDGSMAPLQRNIASLKWRFLGDLLAGDCAQCKKALLGSDNLMAPGLRHSMEPSTKEL